jgi:thiamine pyrophosphate-dependent acetolactate synthase large subunit-like protein
MQALLRKEDGADPAKRIEALGAGGFQRHLSGLETAARWGINAGLLIHNNRSLSHEIAIYSEACGGKLERNRGKLRQFTDAGFAAIAEAMGAKGIRV